MTDLEKLKAKRDAAEAATLAAYYDAVTRCAADAYDVAHAAYAAALAAQAKETPNE
jgi:hypothetical protein